MFSKIQKQITVIREYVPNDLKQAVYPYFIRFKKPFSGLTVAPTFLIIGAMKSGTSSLYKYMTRYHPNIVAPSKKEIHFFDLNYEQGIEWYRANFPFRFPMGSSRVITGESSPYYLFHPEVPSRIAEHYPEMKHIVLLRDPVHRALSHYNHSEKYLEETFESQITKEIRMINKQDGFDFEACDDPLNHSCIARGIYIKQLRRFEQFFPKSQMLVLKSESFFDNPRETLASIEEFLGLPHTDYPEEFPVWGKSKSKPKLSKELEKKMRQFFRPYNEALYDHINERFDWE